MLTERVGASLLVVAMLAILFQWPWTWLGLGFLVIAVALLGYADAVKHDR